jgi:hypothetical protein
MQKMMMAGQLMMSQQLSGTTTYGDLSYNCRQEEKQLADETRFQSELQARTQEELQEVRAAGSMAKGRQRGRRQDQQSAQVVNRVRPLAGGRVRVRRWPECSRRRALQEFGRAKRRVLHAVQKGARVSLCRS